MAGVGAGCLCLGPSVDSSDPYQSNADSGIVGVLMANGPGHNSEHSNE